MLIENSVNRSLKPYALDFWFVTLKMLIYSNFEVEEWDLSNKRVLYEEIEEEPSPPIVDQWIAGMIPK